MGATRCRPSAAQMVCDFFDTAFAVLETWTPDFTGDLAATTAAGAPTTEHLDALVRPYAQTTLDESRIPVYGAGFVAAPEIVRGGRGHLAWWQGPEREKLSLAWAVINKQQIDYRAFDWYSVPEATGRAHLSGPSVDYLCSDEYTITVSTPVVVRGRFAGVAALDLLVESVERQLLPALRRVTNRATLVNSADRIIASTDPCLAPGDPVDAAAPADAGHREQCGPLCLLLG